jgi:hypothetical protein
MKTKLFVFLFLSVLSCNNLERNCTDFKTGDFYSEVTIDGALYTSNFSRTEDTQMEVFEDNTSFAEVRWINDCELVFKTKNPKNMAEKKDIHLKILTTTDSSYTYEYSYVGETKKQKGIAFRAK